jgi:hypothetical protein
MHCSLSAERLELAPHALHKLREIVRLVQRADQRGEVAHRWRAVRHCAGGRRCNESNDGDETAFLNHRMEAASDTRRRRGESAKNNPKEIIPFEVAFFYIVHANV